MASIRNYYDFFVAGQNPCHTFIIYIPINPSLHLSTSIDVKRKFMDQDHIWHTKVGFSSSKILISPFFGQNDPDTIKFAEEFFLPPIEQNNYELGQLADDILKTTDSNTRNFLFKLAIPILQTTDDNDAFAKFVLNYRYVINRSKFI